MEGRVRGWCQSPRLPNRAWLTGRIPVFTQEEGVGWRCRWEDYLEWRSARK